MYYTRALHFTLADLFIALIYTVNFGNFHENFILANSIKRHICDVKNSQLGHDLPSSVNDRMISLFSQGFIFTKLVSRK